MRKQRTVEDEHIEKIYPLKKNEEETNDIDKSNKTEAVKMKPVSDMAINTMQIDVETSEKVSE